MNVVGLSAFTLQYIPESIKFQLENGREAQAKKDIEYVMRYNKVGETEWAQVVDKVDRLIAKNKFLRDREGMLQTGMMADEQGVLKKVMHDKSVLHNIVVMIIVWVCTSLTFYMFNFFIKYMPGDIYFNSIVSSFSVGVLIL